MAANAVGVTAHHGQLVRQLAEFWKMMAKGDAGQTRFHLAEHGAVLARGSHLGIEGLDMRRTALQVEHHHAFAGENVTALAGRRAGGQQLRQSEPAQAQRPDAQKLAARCALAVLRGLVGGYSQHLGDLFL